MSVGKNQEKAFSISELEVEDKKLTSFIQRFKLKVAEIKNVYDSVAKQKANIYLLKKAHTRELETLDVSKAEGRITFAQSCEKIKDAGTKIEEDMKKAKTLVEEIKKENFSFENLNGELNNIVESIDQAVNALE